jgi:CRP-like cAMP-binding protein
MSPADVAAAASAVRAAGWLSRTPPAFQDAVLARCLWSRVPGGTTLTHGGDREGGMYGIASGAVDVTPAVGPADLPIINIARAPWWFGLLPVGLGAPRAVSVTTRSACDVAAVPQAALLAMLSDHPDWWQLLTAQALEHFNTAASAPPTC